jgi:hypothetical protein
MRWTESIVDRFRGAVLAAGELEALCRSDAARAAEGKAWVLLGEAGQGKTHLLVDATRRALGESRPSVTVFGELLTAKDPLTQIAQQLGPRNAVPCGAAAGDGCRRVGVRGPLHADH